MRTGWCSWACRTSLPGRLGGAWRPGCSCVPRGNAWLPPSPCWRGPRGNEQLLRAPRSCGLRAISAEPCGSGWRGSRGNAWLLRPRRSCGLRGSELLRREPCWGWRLSMRWHGEQSWPCGPGSMPGAWLRASRRTSWCGRTAWTRPCRCILRRCCGRHRTDRALLRRCKLRKTFNSSLEKNLTQP